MSNIEIFSPQYNKKIRGYTKLTLDNGREKRVVESENTFYPNNIRDYYKTFGKINSGVPISLKNSIGGIFLFNTTIPSGKKYMPAGTKMIGNGAMDITNPGNPSELGTFVSASRPTSNSYELNYTWDSAHGNGLINSVCLTSWAGGYMGYGNASGNRVADSSLMCFNRPYIYDGSYHFRGNGCFGLYNNYFYSASINSDAKKMIISRTPANIFEASIFSASEVVSEKTFQSPMPQYMHPCDFTIVDGKIYYFSLCMSQWNNGTVCTYPLLIYDIDTDTLEEYNMTNNIGVNFSSGSSGDRTLIAVFPSEEAILIENNDSSSRGFYAIKYKTNTYVSQYNLCHSKLTDDLYYYVEWINDGNFGIIRAIDLTNSTNYKTNGYVEMYERYLDEAGSYSSEYDCNLRTIAIESSNNDNRVFANPLYLATVNNLQTSIAKTDEDILQVKYTLTAE